ncbi:MAG: sigma-54-dependent Fis family transcriptional regulator [Deltaproteobacteria bacterium]|nr:sigma-54-dependent Fis family transcriptional regulator [Deltaproteobacteria bacterium]
MARTVLVIDDEESVRSSIAGALADEGFRVLTAEDGQKGFDLLVREQPDVILLDVWMAGPSGEKQQEGLEVLARIKAQHPGAVVLIMSGHGNIETAVRATKLGAYDFLEKPLSLEKLLVMLQNAFQFRDLSRENQNLRSRVEKSRVMIAESAVMKALKQAIRRVAPANASVLVTGENGTGKELVAKSIHALSNRYDKPFVEVNCAAIPEELIESELFGHEKGSFTGATQMKRGKFDLAHEGTLFLDEIGDMSLKTQAKILRILQEQRFERVGGSQTIEVDVRVIAATNKDLPEEIRKGLFREDLYYRLNVVPFRVPPLRERGEDIRAITEHFFSEFASPEQKTKRLSEDAMPLFEGYSWPGNVRELKNTVERLVIFTDSEVISAEEIAVLLPGLASSAPPAASEAAIAQSVIASAGASLRDAKTEFEKEFILNKLRENDWNISKTAQILGIERSHLHRKIKSFGIDEHPQEN